VYATACHLGSTTNLAPGAACYVGASFLGGQVGGTYGQTVIGTGLTLRGVVN
jgi:hypothetical protein